MKLFPSNITEFNELVRFLWVVSEHFQFDKVLVSRAHLAVFVTSAIANAEGSNI
jgi:hypothetical protein